MNGVADYAGFDGTSLIELLAEVEAELANMDAPNLPYRIAIAGGAAMMTRFAFRFSQDIDVISEDMPTALRQASNRVAARHDLRPDWINDGAKGMAVKLDPDLSTVYEGKHLIVESVSDRYLLAMKLIASRATDLDDCILLVQRLSITTEAELLDLIEAAIPRNESLRPVMQMFAASVMEAASTPSRTRTRPGGPPPTANP